jgi:hypothetical protein
MSGLDSQKQPQKHHDLTTFSPRKYQQKRTKTGLICN